MEHSAWHSLIKQQLPDGYFGKINYFLNQVYSSGTIYPPREKVFNAIQTTDLADVKVVILGQDPYHEPGQAMGLSFSVPEGVAIPPSLQNIFKEIQTDLGKPLPTSGDLTRWASQGVLLLNATLTVQAHAANSHQGLGWSVFTDAAIRALSAHREHLVFMLWGGYARSKRSLIDGQRHLILESVHPSPLSANRGGWFGNHHFSRCNAYLRSHGLTEIDW